MSPKTKNLVINLAPSIAVLGLILCPSLVSAEEIKNFLPCATIRACILMIVNNLLKVVVGVTLVVIIIAGLLYIFSGGNSQLTERAKKALIGATVGFALVIGAQILINQIGCALHWKEATNCGEGRAVVARMITFLFSILGALGLIGILIGSIYYFTAAGDTHKVELGKKIVVSSIIGTVIAVSAVFIVRQVEKIVIQ